MNRGLNRRALLAALLAVAGFSSRAVLAQDAPVVVYLVRHAEKVDDSRDPLLSPAGTARAQLLAGMLKDAGITHVWSTDYQRTRLTAGPTASALGLKVEIYNPAQPAELVARLKATPGRHLVVGHSNTTPGLVKALGGDPQGEIVDTEYDRLYIVTIGGAVTSVLLRYGGGQ